MISDKKLKSDISKSFLFSTQFSLLFTIPSKKSILTLANLLFLRIFHFSCSKDLEQWTKCQFRSIVKTCHIPLSGDFFSSLIPYFAHVAFSIQVHIFGSIKSSLTDSYRLYLGRIWCKITVLFTFYEDFLWAIQFQAICWHFRNLINFHLNLDHWILKTSNIPIVCCSK